jgi:hypothetical protein
MTTLTAFIKTLTGHDIKKHSGLDDVKVLKGTENWNRLRRLCNLLAPSVEPRLVMASRIDKLEIFYQKDYTAHLQRIGDHQCHCLTCGFCDTGMKCLPRF